MAKIVTPVSVDLPHPALPEGDWADAYRTVITRHYQNAKSASEAAFATFPGWVNALMALRNLLVRPLGLKSDKPAYSDMQHVGFFPLLLQTNNQVVVGMNDKHLDFRCIVDLVDHERGQEVTISTIIKRHNILGRLYLATVLPFHRMILRVALARLSRRVH